MKRLLRKCLMLVLPLVLAAGANAQKVAGYFPSYRSGYINTVQWNNLTDCYYSFINADVNGNLIEGNSWDNIFGFDMTTFLNVKSKCQENNVRYHISVGGADAGYLRAARLKDIARNSTARANFAQKIVDFAIYHDLDGINIDWEFPNEITGKSGGNTTDHKNLIQAVRDAINASSKPSLTLGIAVGGEYNGTPNHTQYLDVAGVVNLVDEFHIMAYDFPSRAPFDTNNHASRNDAEESLFVWNTNGIPYSKMMLGVPLYGRKASRDETGGEYNEFTKWLTGANLTNAFNNDSYNGYYYNGKATLEWKVDHIMENGGMGIFVWDLGQDRSDEYSLLGVLKSRMDVACTAPQPSLGPDVGFCTGSVTLNSNVSASAGRTFTWKKDGVNVVTASTSATTYNTNQAGVYTVVVTEGTCSRTDEVKVISGSSLSVTGASRCGAGQVTLTVNNTGGTYDWYDAATSGAKLHTGQTYNPTITATQDFYVQDRGTYESYTLGKASFDNAPLFVQGAEMSKIAHKIHVHQELTLNSVRIFTEGTTTLHVEIVRFDGQTVIDQTNDTTIVSEAAFPGSSHVININKVLTPGSYFIVVRRVSGNNKIYYDINQPASKYEVSGVITIVDSAYVDDGIDPYLFADPSAKNAAYGTFFDWKISTGVAPPCGRTKVTATVNPGPNSALSVSPGTATICEGTNGSIVIANSQTNVTYQLYKGVTPVENSAVGTGSNLTINVSSSNLTVGSNVFNVKASSVGCTDVAMADDAIITVNASVTPAITFNNVTKNYGDAVFSMTGTSNSPGALSYSLVSSVPSGIVTVASNGQVTITGAGTATIEVSQEASGCYIATSKEATLTINKATPTLTITSSSTGTVGTSINLTHTSASGGAVTYSITGGTGTATISGTTLNLTGAGTVEIKATQAATANYNVATATQTITVSSKPTPTITFDNITKTFGDAAFSLSATSNSSGAFTYSLVSSTPSDIVTVASNGQVTINGAGTATVKVDQAEDGSFGAGSKTATITINKANRSVTITSGNAGTVGGTITLTYTISAGTGSATWANTNGTGTATLSGSTLSLVSAGTVSVVVTIAADANYNAATSTSQTITISSKTTPTITFDNVTKIFGDASFNLSASSNSSGAFTYSLVSSNPSGIITVASNGLVTISAAGTATVQVNQAETSTFAAGSTTATITINKATRTVTITSHDTGLEGNTISLAYSLSAGGGTATWSVVNGTGQATLTGSSLSLDAVGAVTVTIDIAADANFEAVSESMIITIDKATGNLSPDGSNGLSLSAYPNPFADNSTIVVSMSKTAHLNLSITDALGKQKYVLVNENVGKGEYNYTTPELSAGVYVIQMIVDDVILTERIVKVD